MRICEVEWCDRVHRAKGLCKVHYESKRLNRPSSRLTPGGYWPKKQRVDSMEYFLDYIEVTESCWIWKGKILRSGHGRVHVRVGYKLKYAHRLAYELFVGEIPEGLVIDHLCEVKPCVNPFHLEPVTAGENTRRAVVNKSSTHTHCRRGHPWTAENTAYYGKSKNRRCKKCNVIDACYFREKRLERQRMDLT